MLAYNGCMSEIIAVRRVPPLQDLPVLVPERPDVRATALRADLLDPWISGNKWYKLKYNLEAARQRGQRTLLSFGGPWSNHLHALAAAGQRHGFATIGVLRGELPKGLNACLTDARDWGMRLHPVSREEYRRREEEAFIQALRCRYGDFHLIPEGGANREGLRGCAEILEGVDCDGFTHIALACGTGTTLAGLATATDLPLLGFQVLRGEGYLRGEVAATLARHGLTARSRWRIIDDFHFGGYARSTPELLAFMESFQHASGLPLEPVYSAKLLLGLRLLIKRDFFPQNSSILLLHGGGLQGLRGFDIKKSFKT